MANTKEPIDLIMQKGRKNLTLEEIAVRKNQELKVESKKVSRPAFLPSKFYPQYDALSQRLLDLKIFTDLDEDLLGRYFVSKENYVKFSAKLRTELARKEPDYALIKDVQLMQDKAFKQVRDCANDLGLSITSRAKLVLPPSNETDDEL